MSEEENQDDDEYLSCDIEYEECVHEGKVLLKCSICKSMFEESDKLIEHFTSSHLNEESEVLEKQYVCHICSSDFESSDYLEEHISWFHEIEPSFKSRTMVKCSYCGSQFSNEYDLKSHVIRDHNLGKLHMASDSKRARDTELDNELEEGEVYKKPIFTCKFCIKTFKTENSLSNHINQEHLSKEPREDHLEVYEKVKHKNISEQEDTDQEIKKPKLSEPSKPRNLLNSDEDLIRSKLIFCIICGDNFKESQGLSSHLKVSTKCRTKQNLQFLSRLSKPKNLFNCHLCKIEFVSNEFLKEHVDSAHIERDSALKERECSICNVRFMSTYDLTKHIASVHEGKKLFDCTFCAEKFLKNDDLTLHLFSTHNFNPHECSQCNIKFISKNELAKHTASVHEGKKLFECTLCSNKFLTKKGKTSHLRSVHMVYTSRECPICNLKLESKMHVKKHLMTFHYGKELLECTMCKETFTKSQHLETHMLQVHKKVKYECLICHECFLKPDELREHSTSVHEGRKFPCSDCKWTFKLKSHLRRHTAKVHEKNKLGRYHTKYYRYQNPNIKCSIINCKSGAGFAFYKIPQDPVKRAEWIDACKFSSNGDDNISVCWKHFQDSDFITDPHDVKFVNLLINRNLVVGLDHIPKPKSLLEFGGNLNLKDYAVPSVFFDDEKAVLKVSNDQNFYNEEHFMNQQEPQEILGFSHSETMDLLNSEYSFCEMEPEVIVNEGEVIEKEIELDIERSVKKSPEMDGHLVCKIEPKMIVKEEIIGPEEIIEPEVMVKEEIIEEEIDLYTIFKTEIDPLLDSDSTGPLINSDPLSHVVEDKEPKTPVAEELDIEPEEGEVCKKPSFKDKDSLLNHTNQKHWTNEPKKINYDFKDPLSYVIDLKNEEQKALEAEKLENELEEGEVYEKLIFKCKFCTRKFKNKDSLSNHINQEHLGNELKEDHLEKGELYKKPKFKCKFCIETFESEDSVSNHINGEHLRKGPQKDHFRCSYCNMFVLHEQRLLNHILKDHAVEDGGIYKPYKCHICPENTFFGCNQKFKQHLETVHSLKACPIVIQITPGTL